MCGIGDVELNGHSLFRFYSSFDSLDKSLYKIVESYIMLKSAKSHKFIFV